MSTSCPLKCVEPGTGDSCGENLCLLAGVWSGGFMAGHMAHNGYLPAIRLVLLFLIGCIF